MKNKNVFLLKLFRLIISILMVLTIPIYIFLDKYLNLPKQDLMMSSLFSLFVFALGLQYHLEEKSKTLSFFLMLFSVMMLIMSIIGFTYITEQLQF